jgi:hypothetical protein
MADQLSVTLDASCHISLVGSTSVQTSAVPASGSHFSIALHVVLQTVLIAALLNCTRLHVATFVVTHGIATATLTIVTAVALDVVLAATLASLSRTLVAAAVLLAAALTVALCSRTRSQAALAVALADTAASLSRTRWALQEPVADTEAVALASRTLCASEVLLELDTAIAPVNLTRTFAAAVVVTPITMASPSLNAPLTPYASTPYSPLP